MPIRTSRIAALGRINPTNLTTVTVNVAAGSASGTATVVTGSTILGFYPAGNVDQTLKNIAISGTTLTVTLAANATAQNNFKVNVLEP